MFLRRKINGRPLRKQHPSPQVKDTFKMKSKFLIPTTLASLTGFLPQSQAFPVLGTADTFAVLWASTVTSTGAAGTILYGDLGVYPGIAITGFPPGIVVNGTTYAGGPVAQQAQIDASAAYEALGLEPVTSDFTGQDLGTVGTLQPGVFNFDTSAQLTGILVLDATNNSNARFDFKIGSTLKTASASMVILTNGAQASNVFWRVVSSATLGTDTAFLGNIIALTSITLDTRATILCGSALALNGAVTLDQNIINNSNTLVPEAASFWPLLACAPAFGIYQWGVVRRRKRS